MDEQKMFLEELAEELRFLPAKELNETLKHYRDKINVAIDYGTPIKQIIAELKSPKEIAENIYKMHGIDYLKKRKKNIKFKEILTAIFSGILILACLLIFVVSSFFIISGMVNLVILLIHAFSFKNVVDIIITTIFLIAYLLIMIIAYIYIIDLFMILINNLLMKIFDAIPKLRNKDFKIFHFTFTTFFNKITKQSKFLLKILISGLVVLVASGIISYSIQGYIYRTINEKTTYKKEILITDSIQNIDIEANKAYITIIRNSEITTPKIIYNYEFDNLEYVIDNGNLKIKLKKQNTNDLLGLIQTPTSRIEINLPNNSKIDELEINLLYGKLIMNSNFDIEEVKINIQNGDLSLFNNTVKKLGITMYNGNSILHSNNIEDTNITQNSGNFSSEKNIYDKYVFTNQSAKVIYKNDKIINGKIVNSSGTMQIEGLEGEKLEYLSSTSLNKVSDLFYQNADFRISNTGSLELSRTLIENELKVTSVANSYQTLSYIKATKLILSDQNGQIVLDNINKNYTEDYIQKQIDIYKQNNKSDTDLDNKTVIYRELFNKYNNYENITIDLVLNSTKSKVSINQTNVENLKVEIIDGAFAGEKINTKEAKLNFTNVGAEILDLYGNVELSLISTTYSNRCVVDYENTLSLITITVTGSSNSELSTKNVNVNYKE